MNQNTLFIGNGFDLNLGIKSRYSDFAQSHYWPESNGSRLAEYINNAKEVAQWFDLEELLYRYASEAPSIGGLEKRDPVADKDFYSMLCNGLSIYLQKAIQFSNSPTATNSVAMEVLHSIAHNGYFDRIYTFNYTPLEVFARFQNITLSPEAIIHLHGSLKTNDIILGITNEKDCPAPYDFFLKSWKRGFKSHNVTERLQSSNEIIFFGISFGHIDYIYFQNFFNSIVEGKYLGKERKFITIFTYDDNSLRSIYRQFKAMGISINELKANSNFTEILTCDPSLYHEEFRVIKERLSDTSREAHAHQLGRVAQMIH